MNSPVPRRAGRAGVRGFCGPCDARADLGWLRDGRPEVTLVAIRLGKDSLAEVMLVGE